MNVKIFSVYDEKAKAYLQPFFCASAGLALRSVEHSMRDQNSPFYLYSGDFTLFEIGGFDDITGRVLELEHHINLGSLLALRPSVPLAAPDRAA
jgi:hypothetical protein